MTEKPDPFAMDQFGQTQLIRLAAMGDFDAVEKLVFSLPGTGFSCQRLALIKKTDSDGKTASDVAEENGHDAIAELLGRERRRMEWYE